MKTLEERLGHTFQDKTLLQLALRHSSYANEQKVESYERLEFLGDSILGMVTAEYLFRQYPNLPEGELTRIRALLVCEESLVEVAGRLGVQTQIRLGKGELSTGARPSIQADVVESIIAGIFLDAGLVKAKQFIGRFILSKDLASLEKNRDFKTALQEEVQKKPNASVSYELVGEEGPDHQKVFFVQVSVQGRVLGQGRGSSKKEAEQRAAQQGLANL